MNSMEKEKGEESQEISHPLCKQDQILEVQSTAVVKYTNMLPIEKYSTLELNTDINLPPHNWLHDNLHGHFGNWTSAKHGPIEFSSLNMAHSFPENIDEVDVISDGENIKKLLKMPFSKTGISMSVNKIGRTLLLDEFDVQDVLSQAAQDEGLTKLTWLQDVFSEEANIDKDQTALRKKKNPSQSRARNMMSKFLYHSLPEDITSSEDVAHAQNGADAVQNKSLIAADTSSVCKALVPFLPEPILKPQTKSSFQRNVLWKFEDTKMLIGSNMPIFGGGKYPAVSLRLNDCSKPINVLTGLDYWLDNLMCNVPEVVMCFHLDGIVQKYEHYKTDELPHIEGSQFSPRVIKDVARNILSFLKSNCTQEGHTYWLFKGNGSDVVKLYDLTSLSDKTADGESANPFSVPVATLLYRVAKNLMNQSHIAPREREMIQLLLTNCLQLLNSEQEPDDHLEIITSSHYLLAELYSLGNDESRANEQQHDDHISETNECENDDEFQWPKTLTISDLSKTNNIEDASRDVSVNLPQNVEKKLHLSLTHVINALKNLRRASYDRNFTDSETKRNIHFPSRPYRLALPDAGFNTGPGDELLSSAAGGNEETPKNFNFRQWQGTFESVLIRKAAELYSHMSSAQAQGTHGVALRYQNLSLGCLSLYRNMEWVNTNHELDLLPIVLCGCGDVFLSMARSRDLNECLAACEKTYGQLSEVDAYLRDTFPNRSDTVFQFELDFNMDVEKLLLDSLSMYEKALDNSTDENQVEHLVKLTKRLGNVRNELGLFYMNTAAEKSADATVSSNDVQALWKKSLEAFNGGIRAFQALDDRANIAILYANTGRLMRTCCQTIMDHSGDHATFGTKERSYYNEAIEFYSKSLRALRERKSYPGVWDRVSWELSGSYYTMGSLIQEYSAKGNTEELERDVSDLMFKALKHCETLVITGQQQQEQQGQIKNRIGMIHYRLASLYHHSLRVSQLSEQMSKQKRHLAELHYSKAADHINADLCPCEWLRTCLERVALLEHQVNNARPKGIGSGKTSKTYEAILTLLLSCQGFFLKLSQYDKNIDKTALKPDVKFVGGICGESTSEGGEEITGNTGGHFESIGDTFGYEETLLEFKKDRLHTELARLVAIFESRLKNCLKELVKTTKSLSKSNACKVSKPDTLYKRMFELVLRCTNNADSEQDSIDKMSEDFAALLASLQSLRKTSPNLK